MCVYGAQHGKQDVRTMDRAVPIITGAPSVCLVCQHDARLAWHF